MIYKQYMELIYYTENIVRKYPKSEKNGLVASIKNTTYDGMKNIIRAQKEKDKSKRLFYLNELDCNLKMIKVFIRVSYKNKYKIKRNISVWNKNSIDSHTILICWNAWRGHAKHADSYNFRSRMYNKLINKDLIKI